MTSKDKSTVTRSRSWRWLGRLTVSFSMLLFLVILLSYWFRFDCCTAVTVYPPWCWFVFGWLLLLPELTRGSRRVGVATCALWLTFGASFFDSPMSLLRSFSAPPESKETLRVVTLNCHSKATAAQEVASLNPDIVLLQESPGPQAVTEMADECFGEDGAVLWSSDTSIVARGDLRPISAKRSASSPYVSASLQLPGSEKTVEVICVRLLPCPVRLDLWSPQCWRVYSKNKMRRRDQMEQVAKQVEAKPSHARICGGDFNAPPRDAVFRLLTPTMTDAFPVAGRGWGRTFMNEMPVIRIDQVWVSKHFEVVDVVAKSTKNSDHRMVVCDLILTTNE